MNDSNINSESKNSENEEVTKKRLLSIDFFKGLTILLMVFVNTTGHFDNIPVWSKHPEYYGLTYVDLIAPFFLFMMALNFRSSFSRRLKEFGRLRAYFRFFYRYLIFIGLGMALSIGETEAGIFTFNWGTLQVLGLSGLIALPFIEQKKYIRISFAILLFISHQLLLETPFKQIIYDGAEGGFFGSLSWAGMMLLSTVLADGISSYNDGNFKKPLQVFGYGGMILIVIGISLNSFYVFNINFLVSRQYMTISYSLISIGIASLILLLIFYVFEIFGRSHPILQKDNIISVLGKNALMLFIIHLIVIFVSFNFFPDDLLLIGALMVGIVSVIIIWITGYFFHKIELIVII
ncbi:MAG: heparan-alpha-glucosaminide N-acetyltransferase domain-containing protein [Promethearchaeota archaeon]